MKSNIGEFKRDQSGLLHYRPTIIVGMGELLIDAIKLASEYKTPVWFWYNGTPAPIIPNDTKESLRERWCKWREDYQNNHASLLKNIEEFSETI
jgi:hypothetical protein